MDTTGFIYPHATLDQVVRDLQDTNRALLRLGELGQGLCRRRREERHETLIKWRDRLEWQRDRMISQGATLEAGS